MSVIGFWKPSGDYGFLSQWWKESFTDTDGTVYNCAEQFMMAKKANLFKDLRIKTLIMECSDPHKMQQYGRQIEAFDEETWNDHKYQIVLDATYFFVIKSFHKIRL